MGFKRSALEAVASLLPKASVLCLSYPDILATGDEVEALCGYRPKEFTDFGKWHGKDYPLPSTDEFFRKMGCLYVKYVDVHASRGIEQELDLNQPQDMGQFDLVIDPGTTEHCFNIGQALMNAANAVKVDGYIFHAPPLSMSNHGFYCLQPTLFYDFYVQNGWKIEALTIEKDEKFFECPRTARFVAPPEASIYVVAQRLTEAPLKFPTQTKYLRNPDLKK